MAIISEWFSTLKQIFSSARVFFQNETDTSMGGKPIQIAFISLLISGIVNSLSTFLTLSGEFQLIALADILLAPITGIISIAVTAALTHLVGMLVGFENGYSETFSAFAYTTVIATVATVASLIPIAGIFIALTLGFFSLYAQIRGVQEFQNVSFGKAAVSVILPVIIVLGILLAVVLATSAALFAAMQGAPTAPM